WNGNNYSGNGSYTVHLINTGGCDSAATLNLTVLPQLIVTATPGNITCFGGTTCVNVTATGGTAAYTSGTGTFCALGQGTYTFPVTDTHGCAGSSTITISEPAKV